MLIDPARLLAAYRFARQVAARFSADDGTALAGNIAFAGMLAMMPFLLFAFALTGFLVGPEGSRAVLEILFELAPEHVARTMGPVIDEVLGQRRGGVLTLSALVAIWASSNGVESVRIALDRAYDGERYRRFGKGRLLSIATVLFGLLTFIAMAVLIVLAPLAFTALEHWTDIIVPRGVDLVRYLAAAALLWFFLWFLHRVLPSRPMRGFVLWPGILANLVVLGAAASGLSTYLAYSPNYALTYGTLAGVVVTLLFFYLAGLAIILGAEMNAVVNRERLPAADRPADSIGGTR